MPASYGVRVLVAVLKAANYRSMGLLTKLGFMQASPEEAALFESDSDEVVMLATPARLRDAALVRRV